ncbi:S-layer homology domain-containing protein [Paenibacillus radicis (ex Xue et al. 2023)]|uniref:S-layer homology domain-containing protein n=1 Tax=Paenibacillus radicis (ex Xue et al. 2023) TaxID=2972489 RepID=A0ABT1YJG2_9BACL|nr:S-layer homology domain-containing protein [Paenibacillus radicis (ex Xue et al. 2023)]MCR8633340.1 S-layer homology domain-containing protein [Paenibacillus radicis (ex Xue et al. 2023)]
MSMLPVTASADATAWQFNVFGGNTSNTKDTMSVNSNGSITLQGVNGGKIASTDEGLAFYNQQLPANANFEIRTKAVVKSLSVSSNTPAQSSFGLMIRGNLGFDAPNTTTAITSNYLAIGGFGVASASPIIKYTYKTGVTTVFTSGQNTSSPPNPNSVTISGVNSPTSGETYDLSIKKSGDGYEVSVNGKSEKIKLDNMFSASVYNNKLYAGFYIARDAEVTFSNFAVTVDSRTPTQLKLDTSSMKTEYFVSDSLDLTGLKATAVYADGHEDDLSPSDYIVTGFDNTRTGTNTITVNFNGKTAPINLNVKPLVVTGMAIKYFPAKTIYNLGDLFDSQGLTVLGGYNNGPVNGELSSNQYTLSIAGSTVTQSTYFTTPGIKTVKVASAVTPTTSTSFDIEVKNVQLTGLEIRQQPKRTQYFVGDQFVPDGMIVYAKYSDGSEARLMRDTEYSIEALNSSTVGTKQIKVTHITDKTKTAIVDVNVKQPAVTGIQVTKYPKTTYQVGQAFDSAGLEVSTLYDKTVFDSTYKTVLPVGQYTINPAAFDGSKAGVYNVAINPLNTSIAPITIKATVKDAIQYQWKSIRFGQSTSDASNKVVVKDDGTVQIIALEGGGKVTGDHDGISYYYTELDANQDNFELSADIKVIEYAKTPYDGQESFGIMARDANGTAGDSSVFTSNIAAVGGYSGGTTKANGTQLFIRKGTGSVLNTMLVNERPAITNTYPAKDYKLTLVKTNSGFTAKVNGNSKSTDGTEAFYFEPDILKVQNSKMYVGFFAARLATIEVSHIDLKVTAAQTDSPKVEAPPVKATPDFNFVSLNQVSKEAYTLGVKSNVKGSFTIKQGQNVIAKDTVVQAGATLSLKTTVTANTYTNFSASFIPDDTQNLASIGKLVKNLTVDMKSYVENGDIYVSPAGTSKGNGTINSPLDLDTAIAYVREGQKILMLDGKYVRSSKIEIKKGNVGTATAKKYLVAAPGAKPIIDFDKKSEGVVLSGNYWHVKGIDFTRTAGNTKGFTVGGSYNTVEGSRFYENGDTGLQISRTDDSEDKASWPSYNLILNCESFDNRDPADNNADGFAAKLTSGVGNIFRGDIAHNNIDDGWDLYTKVGTGAIGAVIIENSIAYNNGTLTDGTVGAGDKNGFKLGGEGIHVPHIIRNSIAFGNGAYGFASNSNPGVRAESNNISFNNAKGNLNFTTYTGIPTDFKINGFVSYQKSYTAKDNYPAELIDNSNFMFNGTSSVNSIGQTLSDANFASLQPALPYQRDAEGNIILGNFLKFIAPVIQNVSHRSSGSSGSGGGGAASVTTPSTNAVISPEPQKVTVDGKSAAQVTLDAAALTKAIETLTASANTITIEVKGTEQVSIVQVPASSVLEAASKLPNAILSIKANGTTYDLPVKAVDITALAKSLGAEAKDVKFSITVEKVSGAAAGAIDAIANKNGATQLAGAIDFTVTAEANGKKTTVNDFGKTYVSRTFEISSSVDTKNATGVMYNPTTGTMTFVPTKFSTNGSSTKVTITRPGNSIYSVVQANKTFSDLNEHWAKADIELLASKLLVNGLTEKSFAPSNPITRAEFAALLVRATGLTEEATTKFSDVKANDWFAGAVGAAAKAGLVDGFENGTFQPGATITREQIAVMIVRAIELAGKKGNTDAQKLAAFEDSSRISAWAKDAVAGAVNAGIVNGITDKSYAPNNQATRAEAAVMLKRLLQFVEFIN